LSFDYKGFDYKAARMFTAVFSNDVYMPLSCHVALFKVPARLHNIPSVRYERTGTEQWHTYFSIGAIVY